MTAIRKTGEHEITRHPELEDLEGYLWRREGARLAWLAEQVPPGRCIVELGAYKGKSTCFLAAGAKAGNRPRIHAVDLWTLGGQGEYQNLGFDTYAAYETFIAQVAATKSTSLVIRHMGDTVEVAERFKSRSPVGLLFIDADHRYEKVAADFQAWLPHLAPDATVAFHDYTATFPPDAVTHFAGVERFVDELRLVHRGNWSRTGRLVDVR